jgi:hypothetical protein
MAEDFDAFSTALRIRDAVAECSCCADEGETQERFELAEQLLAWVVETRAEMAAMRALESGAVKREPMTPAQRSARYRASKVSVTKTVTVRHENRHGAVTSAVTKSRLSSESSSENSQSSSAVSEVEEDSRSARGRHENRHGESDAERDGEPACLPTRDPSRRVTPREAWSAFNRACRDAGHALTFTEHPHEAAWASVAESCNAKGKPSLALETVCRWYWLAGSGPIVGGRVKPGRASPKGFAAQINADLETAGEWMAEQEAAQ